MSDSSSLELKHLLRDAKNTIEHLRHDNEILRAKVEMIDLFACVLHTQAAHRSEGGSIDVAWELQKMLNKIEKTPPQPMEEPTP